MFSQSVEYALRAVVHLAMHEQEAQKTSVIANATKVPEAYLTKILQRLQKAGVVELRRGIGGGVKLAVESHRLTILAVVNAVEPVQRIKTCPLELKAHGKRLCSLHRKMDNSLKMIEESFGSTTLADILATPSPSKALCDM